MNYIIATSGNFPTRGNGGTLDNTTPTLAEISLFAGTGTPPGWALCNGQVLLIAQNTALFSLLGTTYGGNGTTTFNLPDLQSRVATGADFGNGLNGLTSMPPGAESGVESLTLTSDQVPATPEPAGLALLAAVPLAMARRRRRTAGSG